MITVLERRRVERGVWDGVSETPMPPLWVVRVAEDGTERELTFDHDPTDAELMSDYQPRARLDPGSTVGKAALRDLLDEQLRDAQAWEWFAAKCAADGGLPAAAKAAVTALATAEYERAKRLLQAWRQAS